MPCLMTEITVLVIEVSCHIWMWNLLLKLIKLLHNGSGKVHISTICERIKFI